MQEDKKSASDNLKEIGLPEYQILAKLFNDTYLAILRVNSGELIDRDNYSALVQEIRDLYQSSHKKDMTISDIIGKLIRDIQVGQEELERALCINVSYGSQICYQGSPESLACALPGIGLRRESAEFV